MIKKLHDHAKWVVEDALEKWLCAMRGQQYPSKVVLTRIIIVRQPQDLNDAAYAQRAPMTRRYR
jgi:hypothetical protein